MRYCNPRARGFRLSLSLSLSLSLVKKSPIQQAPLLLVRVPALLSANETHVRVEPRMHFISFVLAELLAAPRAISLISIQNFPTKGVFFLGALPPSNGNARGFRTNIFGRPARFFGFKVGGYLDFFFRVVRGAFFLLFFFAGCTSGALGAASIGGRTPSSSSFVSLPPKKDNAIRPLIQDEILPRIAPVDSKVRSFSSSSSSEKAVFSSPCQV